MRHSLFLLTLSLVSVIAANQPSGAQSKDARRPTQPAVWGAPKPVPLPSSRMSQPVDLPDLPEFAGKHKFLAGDYSPLKSGTTYNMSFSCDQTRRQILDWYEAALRNNKWDNVQGNSYYVGGKKKANSCHIIVSDAKFAHARSLITISYYADNGGR
jgi:hypothetical protein